MAQGNFVRLGAIGFALGGVVWILFNLLPPSQATEAMPSGFALVLYILGILLSVVGLAGLHASQRDNNGRIGQAGFYVVLASSTVAILGSVASFLGSATLDWLLVVGVGVVGAIVGFMLYGIATQRAKVLPRWYGFVLFVLGVYGVQLVGLAQLALGIALWMRSDAVAEQPSRVS